MYLEVYHRKELRLMRAVRDLDSRRTSSNLPERRKQE